MTAIWRKKRAGNKLDIMQYHALSGEQPTEREELKGEGDPRESDKSLATNSESKSDNTTRDSLLICSAGLETYFDRENVQLDYELSGSVFADPTIISRIRDWAVAPDSQILYITETQMTPEISMATKAQSPICSQGSEGRYPSVLILL
jgi:hypothetical protein